MKFIHLVCRLVIVILFSTQIVNATTYYVNTAGTASNNGLSWANAKTLQSAINTASVGDEIWIASGTYKPNLLPATNAISTSRDVSFYLNKNLKIYGGFVGTETTLSQRNSVINEVILSGDIGVVNNNSDNCYHVFITSNLDTACRIDGLTIRDGNANVIGTYAYSGRNFFRNSGGGIFNYISSPRISNCKLTKNNSTGRGGGIINWVGSPMITDTKFIENNSGTGGGLFSNYSTVQVYGCEFSINASNEGGGIAILGGNFKVSKSVFNGNSVSSYGGAIHNSGGNLNLDSSVFENDTASDYGGAIYIINSSTTVIKNTVFDGCEGRFGGAMYNVGGTININGSVFTKNKATVSGGAIYNYNSSPSVVNSIFYDNLSKGYGGGVESYGPNSKPTFTNTTFYNNSGDYGAACIYSRTGANHTIKNSILWGSTSLFSGPGAELQGGSSPIYMNTIFETTSSGVDCFIGNPQFINAADPDGPDNIWMTADDGLKLLSSSPALDTGDNVSVSGVGSDILGAVRIQNGVSDLGAYEAFKCNLSSKSPSEPAVYTAGVVDNDSGFVCYCDTLGYFLLALDTVGTGAVIDPDSVRLKVSENHVTKHTTAGGIITNSSGGAIFNRSWDVRPTTQPINDVTVRFGFTNTEYLAIKDTLATLGSTVLTPSDLEMYKLTSGGAFKDPHSSGVTGVLLQNSSVPSTLTWKYLVHPNGEDHTAEFKVSSFSGGGGGGGAAGGFLPVDLVSFTAIASSSHTVNLYWTTSMEYNNSHFDILRSYDGQKYKSVGSVLGQGSTKEMTQYSYQDSKNDKAVKLVYYKLVNTDYDGHSDTSQARIVDFVGSKSSLGIVIYPNPVRNKVNIQFTGIVKDPFELKLTDFSGAELLQTKVDTNATQLDMSEYRAGIYFITVQAGAETKHYKVNKL